MNHHGSSKKHFSVHGVGVGRCRFGKFSLEFNRRRINVEKWSQRKLFAFQFGLLTFSPRFLHTQTTLPLHYFLCYFLQPAFFHDYYKAICSGLKITEQTLT